MASGRLSPSLAPASLAILGQTSLDIHVYAKNVDGTSFSTREIIVLLILSSS
jgi:hypothetical protein